MRQEALTSAIRCGPCDKTGHETQDRNRMQQEAGATRHTEQIICNEEMRGDVGGKDQQKVGNANKIVGNVAIRKRTKGAKRRYKKLRPANEDKNIPHFWRRFHSYHFQNGRSKRILSVSEREQAKLSPSEECVRSLIPREITGVSGVRKRPLRGSGTQSSVHFGSS